MTCLRTRDVYHYASNPAFRPILGFIAANAALLPAMRANHARLEINSIKYSPVR